MVAADTLETVLWVAAVVVVVALATFGAYRVASRTTDLRASDMLERLLWTFVSAFLGAFPVVAAMADVDAIQAAFVAAAVAAGSTLVNWIAVIARHRLEVLPDPGLMGADARRSRGHHPTAGR